MSALNKYEDVPGEEASVRGVESTTTMEREYEFFVTTEEPHQPEGSDRGRIRRSVMRNFFETKWTGPAVETSETNSASAVKAKTRLKSRFRLSKPGQDANEPKVKTKRHTETSRQQAIDDEREGDEGLHDGSPSPSAPVESSQETKSRRGSRMILQPEENSRETGKRKGKTKVLLTVSPSGHRFDPFDVLPVPGTPQLDILFNLFKCGPRTNSMAINARNTWWPFISNDAGLLHATLATWALYGILVRGISSLHVDKLRHKNEAIREVNTKIRDPSGLISDELVGTVSTLASFENLIGAYDAAQLHIAALKRMVIARGGLFAFGHNDGLIKGILWVDFHTAAAFHTSPSFPRVRLDPDTPPLPDELLEEAAYTSPTSLLQLSVAAIDCFNIFYRIHRLALAISSRWIQKVCRSTFSDMLYETEHIILSVPDHSRDFLDFDLEKGDERNEEYEQRKHAADGACVTEALLAGTQIFIYAALREIPSKAKIFSLLLDRLRVAIDRPSVSILDIWKGARNLNTLLWVLVVASSVAPTYGGESLWIGKLSDVVKELGIGIRPELERVLKGVAWADVFFNNVLNRVWKEVCEYTDVVERAG